MTDGILLINKPKGLTSNRVLQQVKRFCHVKKAGHTGTLDPMATGMLPVCMGRATKLVEFMLDADKCYTATIQLGVATTTGDADGEVIDTAAVPELSDQIVQKVLAKLTGIIAQTPPMYSALKYQGKPLYSYARKGIEIDRPAREVNIKSLVRLPSEAGNTLDFQVRCSKGTYVRTLAEQIASGLGTVGHLIALHREYCAGFENQQMVSPDSLENADAPILPIDAGLQHWPRVEITQSQWRDLCHGKHLTIDEEAQDWHRLYCDNQCIAVAQICDGNLVQRKLLYDLTQQA